MGDTEVAAEHRAAETRRRSIGPEPLDGAGAEPISRGMAEAVDPGEPEPADPDLLEDLGDEIVALAAEIQADADRLSDLEAALERLQE